MPLDIPQQQFVRDHIMRWHTGPLRCAICGQQDWAQWEIDSFGVLFDTPRTTTQPHGIEPIIEVRCQQCGQALLFDLAVVSLPPASAPGSLGAP
jgi:hypothetical protein